MTDLLAARSQMAMSLAFHIVFAAVGIGMPLLMVIAESMWLRTKDEVYLTLAKRWAKGTAIMFAVGAVSGTVLSFELGLLWPRFMEFAGPIVGMPFSLEGFAFFLEAIFLGIYLYGWKRVPRWAHLASGIMVMLSGMMSGIFVVTANAWMNQPTGFELDPNTGELLSVDPLAAMLNPAALPETLHMTNAAFTAVGFAVAGIHAFALLKDKRNLFHRRALAIALCVGGVSACLQPMTGHVSAEHVAHHQPVKFAAMEAHFETEVAAPYRLGGWPDMEAEERVSFLEIPYGLSLIAFMDPQAEVKGLEEFDHELWPPVPVVFWAFQVMIGCGVAMMGLSLLGGLLFVIRRRLPDYTWYLRFLVLATPLGMIAIEAGWTVTEVGRQPWVVHGYLKTADAVTPMPGLQAPFLLFTGLYIVLAIAVIFLMRRQVVQSPEIYATPDYPEANDG